MKIQLEQKSFCLTKGKNSEQEIHQYVNLFLKSSHSIELAFSNEKCLVKEFLPSSPFAV